MVEQNRSGAYTQIVYAPTGEKLALMNGQTLVKAFVPLPGKATAVYTAAGLDHYRHPDWLGSTRLTSTPSRAVSSTVAYAPFGETYAQLGSVDPAYTGKWQDTGHRQDTAAGLYDFPLREYSVQGRWPSPDLLGSAAACPKDPQTQNLYAYVRNNPLSYTDPMGAFTYPWDPFGCDPFFDPFCDIGRCSDGRCGGGPIFLFPIFFGGGGGGGGERPRPFPWSLLPLGFFNALQVSASDAAFCSAQAIECFKNAKAREAKREAKIDTPESCWQHCAEQFPPSNPIAAYFFWPCYYGCIGEAAAEVALSKTRLGIELAGCKLQHTACMKGRKSPPDPPTL
jgi:RHS repeat-associated protein